MWYDRPRMRVTRPVTSSGDCRLLVWLSVDHSSRLAPTALGMGGVVLVAIDSYRVDGLPGVIPAHVEQWPGETVMTNELGRRLPVPRPAALLRVTLSRRVRT